MVLSNSVASLSEGLVVTGLKDTAQALNEGRVQRLIVCARLAPGPGWQCHDCLALYAGMEVAPVTCLYCDSMKIQPADLKIEMIARAYQLGCSIQIASRCRELEPIGGIGALLHEGRS